MKTYFSYFISSFVLCSLLSSNVAHAAKNNKDVTQEEYEFVTHDGELSIDNVMGSIMVHAHDKGKLIIKITKHGMAEINMNIKNNKAKIKTKKKRKMTPVVVDYEIWAPKATELDKIKTEDGDITIVGFTDEIKVFTKKGNVTVTRPENIGGKVKVKTPGEFNTDFKLDKMRKKGNVTRGMLTGPSDKSIDLQTNDGTIELKMK